MSLREDLLNGLTGYAVYKIEVDRQVYIQGSPAVGIVVHAADGREPHEFKFADANHMTSREMLSVIRSYLRSRT